MTLSALMLMVSRPLIAVTTRRYEFSRWLLFISLLLLAMHYLLQLQFGFRAQGDDVGAVINILFYAPSSILISYSVVNIASSEGYRHRLLVRWICCYVAILLSFVAGLAIYKSLHIHYALYFMSAFYAMGIVFAIIDPIRSLHHIRQRIENETAADLATYRAVMHLGTALLCAFGVISIAIIFSRVLLAIFGPLILIGLFAFTLCYICFGFHLPTVSETIEEASLDEDTQSRNHAANTAEASADEPVLSPERIAAIESAIARWMDMKGFRDSDTSLASMARFINIPQTQLSQYVSVCQGSTFRVWLSKIRMEEAKRLILEYPNYSNEVIALECGFTSRTYLQHLFKQETGFSPREWRIHQMGEKEA